MSSHMDQMIAEFDKFRSKIRQAEARFEGVEEMTERIAQVRSVATSPDRNVTVTAGANGTVTDIELAQGAMSLGPAELSATLMDTLRRAVAGAVRQQAEAVDDAFGDAFGVNTSEQVRQAQAEAFGAPADDRRADNESFPRGRESGSSDDDFGHDTIYRAD